nr:PRC-barrel domain containing protein [Actinomycetota bacterium]
MHTDVWSYRDTTSLGMNIANVDITGFEVEALDGGIGKIDEATYETGSSYVVVDTGPWIFGKKVMLPAGVVKSIDEA